MIIVDHQISGAQKRHTEKWQVIFVDLLKAVEYDHCLGAIRDKLLSIVIDVDIRSNELMIWDPNVKVRIDGDCEIAIVAADSVSKASSLTAIWLAHLSFDGIFIAQ